MLKNIQVTIRERQKKTEKWNSKNRKLKINEIKSQHTNNYIKYK